MRHSRPSIIMRRTLQSAPMSIQIPIRSHVTPPPPLQLVTS